MSRLRFVIGRLSHDGSIYTFRYERDMPHSLAAALEVGFRPPSAFSLEGGPFSSSELFPIFQRRLPPKWREPEYAKLGIAKEQAFDYLRLTGGRLQGDSFEFLEPLEKEKESYRIEFPVAGWRHYDGEKAIAELAGGTPLTLILEKDNEYDSSAIQILSPTGAKLGYVPRIYAWHIDRSIDQQTYNAEVSELGLESDPQIRVKVRLEGDLAPSPYRALPEGLHALCC